VNTGVVSQILLPGWSAAFPRRGVVPIDVAALMTLLGTTDRDDARQWFRDGRNSSAMITLRLCKALGGVLAPRDQPGFDFSIDGLRWESRNLTERGLSFEQQKHHGAGRSGSTHYEWTARLDALTGGFVVADITQFPSVPYWCLPTTAVRRWQCKKLCYRTARTLINLWAWDDDRSEPVRRPGEDETQSGQRGTSAAADRNLDGNL
jgi:hypothetical protein